MQFLGGMLAGDPAQSFQQARKRKQDFSTGDAEAQGDAAFGRALQQLYAPGPPGAQPIQGGGGPPPTVQPGAPSTPGGGPPQQFGGGMPPGGGAPPMPGGPPGGMPPGGPQMPGGAMPPRPPMPMPGGPQGPMGGPPPQPGMPPGGGGPPMPGGQPNFGQPGGGIGWQQAVQAVVKANPGIEQNPRALARAVDHFMPIMNQQSLQQWRQMQAQSRRRPELELMDQFYAENPGATPEEAATFFSNQVKGGQVRKDIVGAQQAGAGERVDKQQAGAKERVGMQQEGATARAGAAEKGRQDRFATREARLQSKADFDREFKTKSLDLAERRFASTQNKQERDNAYREEKAKLDAQYRQLQSSIAAVAGGATDDKRVQELQKSYDAAVKRLDSIFMAKPSRGGASTTPNVNMGVTLVQTPEEANSLKPGTRYRTPDGQEYTR